MKVCSRKDCKLAGQPQPLENFHRCATSKDGRRGRCRVCVATYSKAWYASNKERCVATTKAYYEANKEHLLAYGKAWHADNKEHKAATTKAWEESNRERMSAYRKAWCEANPDKRTQYRHARRARKLNQFVEDVDPAAVLVRDLGVCGLCSDQVAADYHIDHIIPLSKGGPHSYDNVQLAHPVCNMRKGSRHAQT